MKPFKVADVPYAEECRHVALEHTFYHILAQEALAEIDVFLDGGLRKAAEQKVALEQGEERTKPRCQFGEIRRSLGAEVPRTQVARDLLDLLAMDVREFVKRKCRLLVFA